MSAILLVALAFVLAAAYFLPAIIAVRRRCRWDAAIFVFQLASRFGWFAALSWALGGRIRGRPTEVVAHMREKRPLSARIGDAGGDSAFSANRSGGEATRRCR